MVHANYSYEIAHKSDSKLLRSILESFYCEFRQAKECQTS